MLSRRQFFFVSVLAMIVVGVAYFWLISLGASCGNCPLTNVDTMTAAPSSARP
jgi:hypothetical protein